MNDHVLIIDEDIKLTDLIKKYLENHQYKVSVQNMPIEGYEYFQKNTP